MKKNLFYLLCSSIPLMGFLDAKVEETLSIIKPDAVRGRHIGEIIATFEKNDLQVVALKMTQLSKAQAEQFYIVHKDRPFYSELVSYMSSGPVVVQVLQGENAVAKNRELMGPTDPKKAPPDSIRGRFGTDVGQNAVHGSDSEASAKQEIDFFFTTNEIYEVK